MKDKQLHPTFARTSPQAQLVAKFVASVLLHFDWHKFVIVVERGIDWLKYSSMEEKLRDVARDVNLTVTSTFEYDQDVELHREKNVFYDIIQRSLKITRGWVYPQLLRLPTLNNLPHTRVVIAPQNLNLVFKRQTSR